MTDRDCDRYTESQELQSSSNLATVIFFRRQAPIYASEFREAEYPAEEARREFIETTRNPQLIGAEALDALEQELAARDVERERAQQQLAREAAAHDLVNALRNLDQMGLFEFSNLHARTRRRAR